MAVALRELLISARLSPVWQGRAPHHPHEMGHKTGIALALAKMVGLVPTTSLSATNYLIEQVTAFYHFLSSDGAHGNTS